MREKHRYGAFCAGFRGGSTQKCMIFVVGLGLHHHKNSHKMHGSCNKVLITSHWSYSMLLAATPSISRRLDITLGSKHVFLNVCYPETQIYQEFYREQPLRIHRFNPKSRGKWSPNIRHEGCHVCDTMQECLHYYIHISWSCMLVFLKTTTQI